MSRTSLALAISLTFAALLPGGALAAGETPAKAPAKRGGLTRALPMGAEDVYGRNVFQVLIGEFALRRGEYDLAADAWGDLAARTRDPLVLSRAVEVMGATRYFERGLELADLWQKVEPESLKARQMRSTLLVLANRTDDLAPQLAQMLQQDKANLAANLLQLNRLLVRQTDKKAVLRLVERLIAPYREVPEAQFALAQAAMAAGDEKRALDAAGRAQELRPDWEMAAMLRSQLILRQTGNTAAVAALEQFVERYPQANDARLMLARLLIGERRLNDSRMHFERLIKEAPTSPEVVYPLAMLALQQGDLAFGKGLLERLLDTDFPDKGAVHYFLGQLSEEGGRDAEALGHYAQVSDGEHYFTARGRTVGLLQKQGRIEDARRVLRETRAANEKERTQLVLAETQLLREARREGEAYAVIVQALKEQPDNGEWLYEAGMLAERENQLEPMERYFRRLLELQPDHAHALNALGYSFAERGIRLDEAEKLIRKALALTPDDPFITDSLGWVFFRQNRPDEALSTLRRAYQGKADPEIAAHIGEVLWSMGRRDEARSVLLEAQRQHPGNETLDGIIKKLLP